MIRTLVVLVAGLTLTACASSPSMKNPNAGADPMPEPQPCAAEAYQVLVGQPVGGVHTDSLPRPYRVYGPGDAVTMDYRPDRLNIVVGDDGEIIEVKCG
ncbi:I78 family peptidase inhibitor [Oceanicaulis sp.]|uniref:I78 family peptidase inhibitor n=1 Tax=Oceanicaulis sp. TaxID=1924941 RepID=UPI003BABBB50